MDRFLSFYSRSVFFFKCLVVLLFICIVCILLIMIVLILSYEIQLFDNFFLPEKGFDL